MRLLSNALHEARPGSNSLATAPDFRDEREPEMRAIPKDCELMRRALADAPGVRATIDTFLYETSCWRRDDALMAYRAAFPEVLDMQLDAGKWKSDSVENALMRLAPPPVTPRERELAALIENGQRLFYDACAGLVPEPRVKEVARFLEFLDPAVNKGERWTSLEEILHFYRRAAAFTGLAVLVAYL